MKQDQTNRDINSWIRVYLCRASLCVYTGWQLWWCFVMWHDSIFLPSWSSHSPVYLCQVKRVCTTTSLPHTKEERKKERMTERKKERTKERKNERPDIVHIPKVTKKTHLIHSDLFDCGAFPKIRMSVTSCWRGTNMAESVSDQQTCFPPHHRWFHLFSC